MGKRLADFITSKSDDALYEDSRSMILTHYVMAERLLQVEYYRIMQDEREQLTSETLIYILEGGFKGFHNMEPSELIKEYQEIEDKWYQMYEDNELEFEPYEADPIHKLKEEVQ